MARKRDVRVRKHLHRISSGDGLRGNSWARRQAARRHNRRGKGEKSGYTM